MVALEDAMGAMRLRYPRCGSKQIAEVLDGLPAFPEIEADLRVGRIGLGGRDPQAPTHHCHACSLDFLAS